MVVSIFFNKSARIHTFVKKFNLALWGGALGFILYRLRRMKGNSRRYPVERFGIVH